MKTSRRTQSDQSTTSLRLAQLLLLEGPVGHRGRRTSRHVS